MKTAFLVVLLWAFSPMHVQAFNTANDLAEACRSDETVIRLVCTSYINGFEDASLVAGILEPESSGLLCFPDGVSPEQMRLMFLKFIQEHPEKLHIEAVAVFYEMLRDAFGTCSSCGTCFIEE